MHMVAPVGAQEQETAAEFLEGAMAGEESPKSPFARAVGKKLKSLNATTRVPEGMIPDQSGGGEGVACGTFVLDLNATGFNMCKICGRPRGEHEERGDGASKELGTKLRKRDEAATSPRAASPRASAACGAFKLDLSGDGFNVCANCGHPRSEHEGKSDGASDELGGKLRARQSAATSPSATSPRAATACDSFELDLRGDGFNVCKKCGRPRSDHAKSPPRELARRNKNASPERPTRTGSGGGAKTSPCATFELDLSGDGFNVCVHCGHPRSTHASKSPASPASPELGGKLKARQLKIESPSKAKKRACTKACAQFQLDLSGTRFDTCVCGYPKLAHAELAHDAGAGRELKKALSPKFRASKSGEFTSADTETTPSSRAWSFVRVKMQAVHALTVSKLASCPSPSPARKRLATTALGVSEAALTLVPSPSGVPFSLVTEAAWPLYAVLWTSNWLEAAVALLSAATFGRAFKVWWEDPSPSTLAALAAEWQSTAVKFVSALALRQLASAVRNPVKAWRLARRGAAALRRARWSLPLIQGLRNVVQSLRRYRRAFKARVAKHRLKRAARKFRATLYDDAIERAALKLQCAFRVHRARARKFAASMLEAKNRAVLRLQANFRAGSARRRIQEMKSGGRHASDRRRDGLLIRPDSRFRGVWDASFALLVVVELALLCFRRHHGESPPRVLRRLVVGSETANACLVHRHGRDAVVSSTPPRQSGVLGALLLKIRGRGAEVRRPPSWCQSSSVQARLSLAAALAHALTSLVALFAVLDVPINFFSGIVDPATGILKPRSFVARWLVPGLLLQIFINPSLKDVYAVVMRLVSWLNADVTRIFGLLRAYIALAHVRAALARSAMRAVHSYYQAHAFLHRRHQGTTTPSTTD